MKLPINPDEPKDMKLPTNSDEQPRPVKMNNKHN